MEADELRRFFRTLFFGQHEVTPREGDHLAVEVDDRLHSVWVNDVTTIDVTEHEDGSTSERISIILEGDLEIVLADDSYEFLTGNLRRIPMSVRSCAGGDGASRLYEALLHVNQPGVD